MRSARSTVLLDGRVDSEATTCWQGAAGCAATGDCEPAGGMAAGEPAGDGAGGVGAPAGARAIVVEDVASTDEASASEVTAAARR